MYVFFMNRYCPNKDARPHAHHHQLLYIFSSLGHVLNKKTHKTNTHTHTLYRACSEQKVMSSPSQQYRWRQISTPRDLHFSLIPCNNPHVLDDTVADKFSQERRQQEEISKALRRNRWSYTSDLFFVSSKPRRATYHHHSFVRIRHTNRNNVKSKKMRKIIWDIGFILVRY